MPFPAFSVVKLENLDNQNIAKKFVSSSVV